MDQGMRQKIGIGFASLAVAMFAVALLSALNEPPNEANEQSSLVADEPIPTDFLNDFESDNYSPTPAPSARSSTTSRRSTTPTRRAAAPAPQAPAPTAVPEGDDNQIPADYYQQTQGCGGNGSHGDSGGGGGGCGGGDPGAQWEPPPPDEGSEEDEPSREEEIAAGGGGPGGEGGDG